MYVMVGGDWDIWSVRAGLVQFAKRVSQNVLLEEEKLPVIEFPLASVMDADPEVGSSVKSGGDITTPEGEVTVAEGAAVAAIDHPEPSVAVAV